TCGSPMPRLDEERGIALVSMGGLDGDPSAHPTRHIYVGSKAPWYDITDDLPQFAEMLRRSEPRSPIPLKAADAPVSARHGADALLHGLFPWSVRSVGSRVRRLVTLGAPYYSERRPARELAIFAAHDPLVPPPADERGRMIVVEDCGHLNLLRHPAVLHAV